MPGRVIRTFAMMGADGAGKTALVEALLRVGDARRASPEGSTSRLDAEPEEKKRNFTLSLHPESFEESGRTFHVLDCPGFAALLTEVEWALQVTDGAFLAVSAVDGAHNRTERTFDLLDESRRPAIAVVTRIDDEDADFGRTVADLETSLKVKPIPVQLPIGTGGECRGLVDLVAMKAHLYDRKAFASFELADVPAELADEVESARTALVEAAAECDDELLGKYLEGGSLTDEELARGIAIGTRERRFLPVAVAYSKSGIGLREILDLAVAFLPGPEEREAKGRDLGGREVSRAATPAAPFCGQVFKTTIDHFAGRVDYVRVFSGTLKPEATVMNPRTRTEERIAHEYRTDGAQNLEVQEAGPGDFVVLVKLKDAHTGDTLCDPSSPIALPEFAQRPRPVAYAVRAKAGADDKVAAALQKLIEEDPSLELVRQGDTGELLIKGMGQAHIDVTVERAKRKHGVDITLSPPTPSYLETITATAKAQGKFKRQTGGHGQYGDAHVELSPLPRGTGFEFEDAIVGGVIPRQFIPSVEKGIRNALGSGPLAGYPVVDFRAKLVFGSYHDVDSSDMAFQVAGSMAFKKAMQDARPILLEPIMSLEVRVPEEYVGAVMGDLNSRRAKVQGMEPAARGVVIRALCPHAEAMTYDADLRSLTQGVGYFDIRPSHYEPVPPHIAQKIIEKR
ncbi:MAG TPA: elongation factor G, partial [Anaeromyxobacteraceae bacterium]|nr:elongation factor G [Anaeromyxobacteraceae bacterium]